MKSVTCKTLSYMATGVLALIFNTARGEEGRSPFNYDDYAEVLTTYVDDQGMVHYRGLKARPQKLNAFVTRIGNLSRDTYNTWDQKERVAFWINAYNAITLKAIIRNYPIKSSWAKSLKYPKNSIRQISGVWDKLKFKVRERSMTLDGIEHDTLREYFNEPRIHVALVCAAMGCPPLRNEPYVGEKLDVRLDDQTRKFLRSRKKLRIDRGAGRVYLSPIFKWFGEDFIKTYGTSREFTDHGREERAVLNFVSRYLDEGDKEFLSKKRYKIKYLDYNWSLNERSLPVPERSS